MSKLREEVAELRRLITANIDEVKLLRRSLQATRQKLAENVYTVNDNFADHKARIEDVVATNLILSHAHMQLAACVGDSLGQHDDAEELRRKCDEAIDPLRMIAAGKTNEENQA